MAWIVWRDKVEKNRGLYEVTWAVGCYCFAGNTLTFVNQDFVPGHGNFTNMEPRLGVMRWYDANRWVSPCIQLSSEGTKLDPTLTERLIYLEAFANNPGGVFQVQTNCNDTGWDVRTWVTWKGILQTEVTGQGVWSGGVGLSTSGARAILLSAYPKDPYRTQLEGTTLKCTIRYRADTPNGEPLISVDIPVAKKLPQVKTEFRDTVLNIEAKPGKKWHATTSLYVAGFAMQTIELQSDKNVTINTGNEKAENTNRVMLVPEYAPGSNNEKYGYFGANHDVTFSGISDRPETYNIRVIVTSY